MTTQIKTKTTSLTKDHLQTPKNVADVLLDVHKARQKHAGNAAMLAKIKVKGKAVVRKKGGAISYSDPEKVGQFNEENLQ